LKEIAKINEFNKKRVTLIYGISLKEIDEDSTGNTEA
jgi:hypothetical protein